MEHVCVMMGGQVLIVLCPSARGMEHAVVGGNASMEFVFACQPIQVMTAVGQAAVTISAAGEVMC